MSRQSTYRGTDYEERVLHTEADREKAARDHRRCDDQPVDDDERKQAKSCHQRTDRARSGCTSALRVEVWWLKSRVDA